MPQNVEWFENVFLKECGPQRPQLLIVDSHCSHEPLDLIQLAQAENITLLNLPSHCTHYLQPWDKCMFAPLKKKYNILCSEYMTENTCNNITKASWPAIFNKVWSTAITEVNMVSGFVATGICPYNPNAIPDEAYLTSVHHTDSDVGMNVSHESTTQDNMGSCPSVMADMTDEERNESQIIVTAEVHQESSGSPSDIPVTLELPILVDENTEIITLPVSFADHEQEHIPSDLSNVVLEEIEGIDTDIPTEYWNVNVESMFLPEVGTPVTKTKTKSSASSSRILTSPEIIQAKKEMIELKESKAKAALERKARAQERKKKAQEKKMAKLIKQEVKNKKQM